MDIRMQTYVHGADRRHQQRIRNIPQQLLRRRDRGSRRLAVSGVSEVLRSEYGMDKGGALQLYPAREGSEHEGRECPPLGRLNASISRSKSSLDQTGSESERHGLRARENRPDTCNVALRLLKRPSSIQPDALLNPLWISSEMVRATSDGLLDRFCL